VIKSFSKLKCAAVAALGFTAVVSHAADFVSTNSIIGATNAIATAAATTTTTGANLPDAGASLVRVAGALLLVIAVFLGGVWMFRNWQRLSTQRNGGAKLNLLEVKSLGQRQSLYVVGYQQQRMLLASSPAGVTLVSHLPEADEAEAAAPAPKINFAEAFQQVLNRK
jgi:flagellar biogenesis protein FliO